MEALGRGVEAVIGKARNARVQVSTRGGMQPILSIESQLTPIRIRDLIESATQKVIDASMPNLAGQAALEVGEGPVSWGGNFLAHQAAQAMGVEIGGGSIGRQGDISRGFVVRAGSSKLPFADNSFSYLIARMATSLQGDISRSVREFGRVLTAGGHGVIVDYHPFGLYAKHGANRIRSADANIHRMEDYYKLCRKCGLRVMDLREAFVDEGMRQFFREAEIPAYRSLKGTPLLVFLFVYKPKGLSSH